jgi:hypothetical protein
MNIGMNRRMAKAAALLLLVAALVLSAAPARCDGGEEDICKRALLNCLIKGFGGGGPFDQIVVLLRLEYCLAGFEFCSRYVSLYV